MFEKTVFLSPELGIELIRLSKEILNNSDNLILNNEISYKSLNTDSKKNENTMEVSFQKEELDNDQTEILNNISKFI
jgi:hypothetical protein